MAEENQAPEIIARKIIREGGKASLATLSRDDKSPYASLVIYACLADASPVMLLSDLAEHAINLSCDARCSLLIDALPPGSESLAGMRLTIQGEAHSVSGDEAENIKSLIIARHPEAATYAEFADFKAYKIIATRMHLIGGFGMIHWLEAQDVLGED